MAPPNLYPFRETRTCAVSPTGRLGARLQKQRSSSFLQKVKESNCTREERATEHERHGRRGELARHGETRGGGEGVSGARLGKTKTVVSSRGHFLLLPSPSLADRRGRGETLVSALPGGSFVPPGPPDLSGGRPAHRRRHSHHRYRPAA